MSRQISLIIVALILSLGLIISTVIFSYFFYKFDGDNNIIKKINTTGYAEKYFHADFSIFEGKLSKETNVKAFEKYLNKQGIKSEEITFTKDKFIVESELIHKIEEVYSIKNEEFNHKVKYDKPKYFIKNNEEIKIQLLADATKNAKNKAGIIAENSNSVLGKIISADMGNIKYLNLNSSVEFNSPQELDIYSKRKRARINVNQVYEIE